MQIRHVLHVNVCTFALKLSCCIEHLVVILQYMQQDDTNRPVDECCTAHCSTADDDCWLSSALLTYCWKLAAMV